MNKITLWGNLLTAVALSSAGTATAEWRCDCTSIVGSCSASASAGESFIEVTSNTAQCARVDYFVDGIPFVALVVDGVERQNWITQTENPSIIVQGCQICLDNAADGVVRNSTPSATDGERTRIIEVAPTYPPAAAAAGIEGHVDVRFTVAPDGGVSGAEVVEAEPADVFDRAALAAVRRWRYSPSEGTEPETMTDRVSFDLDDAVFGLRETTPSPEARSGQAEPVLNRCVREGASYDFGAMIDVSLINACQEPLVVHSCAAGVGPSQQQWICREGELAEDGNFQITRAPNSEYWWLACSIGDAACRGEGQLWIRSMHRQLASVDPRDRTRAPLARSF
jgi:TonB family protein